MAKLAAVRPLENYTVDVVKFRVVREAGHMERAPLSDVATAATLAAALIPDDAREHFWLLLLDAQNRLVAGDEVSVGTLSASLVDARGVFGPALRVMGVASLILVHNHPSGDPEPSREDIRLTRELVQAGRLLGLTVHDHVILGNPGHVSMAGRGLL
jgi:DNA repair protein RadC